MYCEKMNPIVEIRDEEPQPTLKIDKKNSINMRDEEDAPLSVNLFVFLELTRDSQWIRALIPWKGEKNKKSWRGNR